MTSLSRPFTLTKEEMTTFGSLAPLNIAFCSHTEQSLKILVIATSLNMRRLLESLVTSVAMEISGKVACAPPLQAGMPATVMVVFAWARQTDNMNALMKLRSVFVRPADAREL